MRPLDDWADLMFNPDHAPVRSHIVPFGQPYALCGAAPLVSGGWWGTGNFDEIEQARALPRCEDCADRVTDPSRQVG